MSMRLGGPPCCCFGFAQLQPAAVRLRVPVPPARAADTSASQSPARLRAVLDQVDEALRKGNDEAALSLVRGSQGEDGGLGCFGAARQVCVVLCPLVLTPDPFFNLALYSDLFLRLVAVMLRLNLRVVV